MRQRLQRLFDRIKHTLRRVLIALMFIVAVILVTIILLAPREISDAIEDVSIFIRIMILLVVYAIAAFVVYQEVIENGENDLKGLIVKSPGGTITTLEPESAQERIFHALDSLAGLEQVKVNVQAMRGKAIIDVNVIVQNESINIPEKQREINQTLEKVVEKQLGLQMAERPRIQISFKHKGSPSSIADSTNSTSKSETVTTSQNMAVSATDGLGSMPMTGAKAQSEVKPSQQKVSEDKDKIDSDDDPAFWSFLEKTAKESNEEDENKGENS